MVFQQQDDRQSIQIPWTYWCILIGGWQFLFDFVAIKTIAANEIHMQCGWILVKVTASRKDVDLKFSQ